jgi:hypothetical protein
MISKSALIVQFVALMEAKGVGLGTGDFVTKRRGEADAAMHAFQQGADAGAGLNRFRPARGAFLTNWLKLASLCAARNAD